MTLPAFEPAPAEPAHDHRVRLHGVPWDQYEALLAIRGDSAGVRMTYLEGELELMSPSVHHEGIKTVLARLVEAYAEERELELNGFGSWTVKEELEARGVEPDECYILGPEEKPVPDLAIEVIWTSGGIDKLAVYQGLGVPEVWLWQKGRISVYRLHEQGYVAVDRSVLLPELDLDLLLRFLDLQHQTRAVRAFRQALRQAAPERTGAQPPK